MKFSQQEFILKHNPADVIIDTLTPYINDTRQQRINSVINARINHIQLAIECPADVNNAFAAMRSAEALGIYRIHIISPEGSAAMAKSISQSAFYWLDISYYTSLTEFLEKTKPLKLTRAGGSVTATQPLHTVPVDQPLCLMVGNEHRGLSTTAEQACQVLYKIPMVGMSESMNLSVSAAISMYDTSLRYRQQLGNHSDLSLDEQLQLRAYYYLNSVAPRLACGLFNRR